MRHLHTFLLLILFVFPTWVYWQEDGLGTRAPANFASNSCRELIENLSNVNVAGNARRVRGSFGHAGSTIAQGKHLQFGFESEYGLSEIDKIVTVYGPKPGHGISKTRWFDMSVVERAQWVRDNIQTLFPEPRQPGGLIKLKDQAGFKFLPESLIQDDTGNIEFVFEPFNTYEEWYRAVKKFNLKFGPGSQQATISAPFDSFFGEAAGVAKTKAVNEKIGLLNFYSEYDILQKLNAGHLRYLEDDTRLVARNFEHPFLGPMTSKKQTQLQSFLRANANGEKLDDEAVSVISGMENSFKYTGGTVYRPDILNPDRAVLEIRDAHKNFNLLADRLLRSLFFMEHGTGGLDNLKDLKSFDMDADFAKLPKKVKDELKRLFPNKANSQYTYTAAEKKALDVFKNFGYPMRDWSAHLEALGADSIADEVAQAQTTYKNKLSEIVGALRYGEIDDAKAKIEIQGALAEFANKSKLAKAFEDYEENVILAGERAGQMNSLIREISIESGALLSSFPEKIWSGPILERAAQLQAKYPDIMKKVDGVKFNFNGNPGGRRNMYIISFNGLSEEKKAEFLEDYFAAMSENTVSFPLSESAGHLYTRVGNKSYDFYFGSDVRQSDYPMPSERLEAFLELESDEFLRLRQYIQNGTDDGNRLLGNSGYNGVTDASEGTLTNNRPTVSGQSHNCTSWLCMAPIGDGGEAIHDIAGAPRSHNIHTNPGWWSAWLANYATRERVPFVVRFTHESIDDAVQKATDATGSAPYNWRFGEH